MMIFKKILLIILMVSCSNDEKNPNDNFLKKFKNDDFTKFSGNSFFVRGFDKGNPIVFVYSDECKHPLVITVNSQTNTILKISKHLQIDTCNINTMQKEMLTLSFLKYNINYLEVDENLDVYINVMFEEKPPQLARITNPEKIKGNWKKIIDNWYELRK